ncbi:MAG: NUMOD4 motif-containing HNH endonuclease [Proteobacteria bacterium]|nr:NUMOD4 motif-containing HNH endonuclease [Pseudomonadota bacterium]
MSDEIWKTIPGFSNYSVSNFGSVRRDVESSRAKAQRMKTGVGSQGYAAVSLTGDNGKCKKLDIHGLVAAAFIGERPVGMVVCHADGDRKNPHLSNLRYGTFCDNAKDAIAHGTQVRGSKQHLAKLNERSAGIAARLLKETPLSLKQIASIFGVTSTSVLHLAKGKTWVHVTGGPIQRHPLTSKYAKSPCLRGLTSSEVVSSVGLSLFSFVEAAE